MTDEIKLMLDTSELKRAVGKFDMVTDEFRAAMLQFTQDSESMAHWISDYERESKALRKEIRILMREVANR